MNFQLLGVEITLALDDRPRFSSHCASFTSTSESRPTITSAPTRTPLIEPMPPTMTMQTARIETVKS